MLKEILQTFIFCMIFVGIGVNISFDYALSLITDIAELNNGIISSQLLAYMITTAVMFAFFGIVFTVPSFIRLVRSLNNENNRHVFQENESLNSALGEYIVVTLMTVVGVIIAIVFLAILE